MTIQEALRKVEEVGYPLHRGYATTEDHGVPCHESVHKVFHDPIFWFALGWSLGWHEKHRLAYDLWWRQPWHRFIDHAAEGKPPEAFFEHINELPQAARRSQP
jgi:hypothetical protein